MIKKKGLVSSVIFLGVLLFFLTQIDSVEAAGEVNISNCSMNTSAGHTIIHTSGTYWLNKSMNSSGRCLWINGSNIELDCRGWSINGTKIQDAIYSNGTNITIKNCIIHNFSIGINLSSALSISLINNTVFNNNVTGIFLASTNNSLLENNTAYFNNGTGYENYGIHLQSSKNNCLINNNASFNGDADGQGNIGIYLVSSTENNLSYNTANNNTLDGIALWVNSNNNRLINNTANNNSGTGISLDNSFNNYLSNNFASNNTNYGIGLTDSDNNNLISNKAKSNDIGIRLDMSHNNTLSQNLYLSNNTRGISLLGANNNTLDQNFANNNTLGIYLWEADNNTISRNTIKNNTAGIYLESHSDNNTVGKNTANKNIQHGIYLDISNENIFINNTCNNNKNGNGIHLQGNSNLNTFRSNTILYNFNGYDIGGDSVNNTFTLCNLSNPRGWDIHMDDGTDNKFYNITVFSNGTTNLHKTMFSFKKYNNTDMHLRGVEAPETDPAGLVNISKYVFITKREGDWVVLNISYSDSDIANVNESSLKMYRRNNTWEELNSTVNITLNFVSANLSNYSNFGLFGEEKQEPEPPGNGQGRGGGGGSSSWYAYGKKICECVMPNGSLFPEDCEKPLLKVLPLCYVQKPSVIDNFVKVFEEELEQTPVKVSKEEEKGIAIAGKAGLLPGKDTKTSSKSLFGILIGIAIAVVAIVLIRKKQPPKDIKYEDLWTPFKRKKFEKLWNPLKSKKFRQIWKPWKKKDYKPWNPFKKV